MASPTPFYKIICLVICVSLAWFSVVAKPIELPTLGQRRYMSNLSNIVNAVEGVHNGGTHGVNYHLPTTLTIATATCVDHDNCPSGSVVTDAAPIKHELTCSTTSDCSLDGESVGVTHSCLTHGGATGRLDALSPTSAGENVSPFLPLLNQEFSPAPYSTDPVDTPQPAMTDMVDTTISPPPLAPAPRPEETITYTARLSKGHDGEPDEPQTTLSPEDASLPVPGQQTVYVTITEDSTTASPIPTAPFNNLPLSTVHPESNKTAIILGSVFGSLAVLCISIVSVDHLLKLRRQKLEKLQQCQESQESQERHESISSVEDMSELLRRQQQTYGYYGTQRVASSSIVPQQMKVFPASLEPVELPAPKDETVETERRDGH